MLLCVEALSRLLTQFFCQLALNVGVVSIAVTILGVNKRSNFTKRQGGAVQKCFVAKTVVSATFFALTFV